MVHHSVFCLALTSLQAEQMVQKLKREAFLMQYISVVSAIGPLVTTLGDLTRGLFNLGVPLLQARLYESQIKEGCTLVSVQTQTNAEITLAKDVLRRAEGTEICATYEPMSLYRSVPFHQLNHQIQNPLGVE